eukprot:jgi/Mesen1/7449/ME000389S06790
MNESNGKAMREEGVKQVAPASEPAALQLNPMQAVALFAALVTPKLCPRCQRTLQREMRVEPGGESPPPETAAARADIEPSGRRSKRSPYGPEDVLPGGSQGVLVVAPQGLKQELVERGAARTARHIMDGSDESVPAARPSHAGADRDAETAIQELLKEKRERQRLPLVNVSFAAYERTGKSAIATDLHLREKLLVESSLMLQRDFLKAEEAELRKLKKQLADAEVRVRQLEVAYERHAGQPLPSKMLLEAMVMEEDLQQLEPDMTGGSGRGSGARSKRASGGYFVEEPATRQATNGSAQMAGGSGSRSKRAPDVHLPEDPAVRRPSNGSAPDGGGGGSSQRSKRPPDVHLAEERATRRRFSNDVATGGGSGRGNETTPRDRSWDFLVPQPPRKRGGPHQVATMHVSTEAGGEVAPGGSAASRATGLPLEGPRAHPVPSDINSPPPRTRARLPEASPVPSVLPPGPLPVAPVVPTVTPTGAAPSSPAEPTTRKRGRPRKLRQGDVIDVRPDVTVPGPASTSAAAPPASAPVLPQNVATGLSWPVAAPAAASHHPVLGPAAPPAFSGSYPLLSSYLPGAAYVPAAAGGGADQLGMHGPPGVAGRGANGSNSTAGAAAVGELAAAARGAQMLQVAPPPARPAQAGVVGLTGVAQQDQWVAAMPHHQFAHIPQVPHFRNYHGASPLLGQHQPSYMQPPEWGGGVPRAAAKEKVSEEERARRRAEVEARRQERLLTKDKHYQVLKQKVAQHVINLNGLILFESRAPQDFRPSVPPCLIRERPASAGPPPPGAAVAASEAALAPAPAPELEQDPTAAATASEAAAGGGSAGLEERQEEEMREFELGASEVENAEEGGAFTLEPVGGDGGGIGSSGGSAGGSG